MSVRAVTVLMCTPSYHSATNIPNDESNLNAGALPDGRVYLLNNPVFEPKTAVSARHNVASGTLRFRDPVVVATSVDGYQFNKVCVAGQRVDDAHVHRRKHRAYLDQRGVTAFPLRICVTLLLGISIEVVPENYF
eukprot:m.428246 g.428246  ORF g.428246 m.428246 type:complete len:135 (+) comp21375_c0_seq3:318-722(+)